MDGWSSIIVKWVDSRTTVHSIAVMPRAFALVCTHCTWDFEILHLVALN
jgi:hypothetical protein